MEQTKHNLWYSPLFRKVNDVVGRIMLNRFERQCKRANKINQQTLWKVIELQQESEFGRNHDFATLLQAKNEQGYRQNVPLSTYATYQTAIDRMKAGEESVLTTEPPQFFAVSSGTTGRPKEIPITRRHQSFTMRYMAFTVPAIIAKNIPNGKQSDLGVDLLSFAASNKLSKGGVPIGGATAEAARRMSRIIPHLWNSPIEVYTLPDQATAWYLHALYGLRNRKNQFAEAVFAPHLLEWFRSIERHWVELIEDIEQGTLADWLSLDKSQRARFLADCNPDPDRAAELRVASTDGFTHIIQRIWPELSHVMTITSGSFSIYLPALRAYLGDIPIFSPSYGATESFIGIALWPDKDDHYVLATDVAYFEFIPYQNVDDIEPIAITIEQLEVGQMVEVVVTNFAGLYRYRLGDIVKVMGYHHQAPILQFQYRNGDHFALVGEHTTDAHIRAAMQEWSDRWLAAQGCTLLDYTTSATTASPPHYSFYIEVSGELSSEQLSDGAMQLDQILISTNPDLAGFRRDNLLGQPSLHLLVQNTFERLYDQLLDHESKPRRNQLKIPRQLRSENHLRLVEQHITLSSSNANRRPRVEGDRQ